MTRAYVKRKSVEWNHCDCGNPLGRELYKNDNGAGRRCDTCADLDDKRKWQDNGAVERPLTEDEEAQLSLKVPPELQSLVRRWAGNPRRHTLYRLACLQCGEDHHGGPVPVWELQSSAFDIRCPRCGGQCYAEDMYDFDFYPVHSSGLVAADTAETLDPVAERPPTSRGLLLKSLPSLTTFEHREQAKSQRALANAAKYKKAAKRALAGRKRKAS